MATLVVLAGLPGCGKSTIARLLAQEIRAVWLRIDSIEQAIRSSGIAVGSLDDAGYRVGYALAEDNLKLGHNVVADSVNPWMLTRNAWRDAGVRADSHVIEVEINCSDLDEHRRRVESRMIDVPGLPPVPWQRVVDRDYHLWDREPLVIDTFSQTITDCVEIIRCRM